MSVALVLSSSGAGFDTGRVEQGLGDCMTCECGNAKFFSVSAKCSDMCCISFEEEETDGYVPHGLSIGGGDYVEIDVCTQCGRIQNFEPLTDKQVYATLAGEDPDDFDDEDLDEDEDD